MASKRLINLKCIRRKTKFSAHKNGVVENICFLQRSFGTTTLKETFSWME
jgi:hypothetical protein